MGNAPSDIGGSPDGDCVNGDLDYVQVPDEPIRALPLPSNNGESRLPDGTVVKTSHLVDMSGGDCTKPQQPYVPREPHRMNTANLPGAQGGQRPTSNTQQQQQQQLQQQQMMAMMLKQQMAQGGANNSQGFGMMAGGQGQGQGAMATQQGFQQPSSYPQSTIKTIQVPSAAVHQQSQISQQAQMQQMRQMQQGQMQQMHGQPQRQMQSETFLRNQYGYGYTSSPAPYMPGVQGLTPGMQVPGTPQMQGMQGAQMQMQMMPSGIQGVQSYPGVQGMQNVPPGMYYGAPGMSIPYPPMTGDHYPGVQMQTGMQQQQQLYPGVMGMQGAVIGLDGAPLTGAGRTGTSVPYREYRVG